MTAEPRYGTMILNCICYAVHIYHDYLPTYLPIYLYNRRTYETNQSSFDEIFKLDRNIFYSFSHTSSSTWNWNEIVCLSNKYFYLIYEDGVRDKSNNCISNRFIYSFANAIEIYTHTCELIWKIVNVKIFSAFFSHASDNCFS